MKKIKVLIVEDNSNVAELTKEYVKISKFFKSDIDIAPTIKECFQKMNSNVYDIILLDLMLPNSKGANTFKNIHDRYKSMPIIVITAHEDLALKVLEMGAQDSFVKTCLNFNASVLNRSILYAIKRKEIELKIHNKNKELQIAYETLHTLLDGADDMIWSKCLNGRYTFMNKSLTDALNIKGYKGRTINDILKGDNSDIIKSDKEVIKIGKTFAVVEQINLNNGETLWFDAVKSPIFNKNRKLIGIVGTARDITKHVMNEKNLKIFINKQIVDWDKDMKEEMKEVNQNIKDSFTLMENYMEMQN